MKTYTLQEVVCTTSEEIEECTKCRCGLKIDPSDNRFAISRMLEKDELLERETIRVCCKKCGTLLEFRKDMLIK